MRQVEKLARKPYGEWADETFTQAKEVIGEVINIARREKLKRLRVGKPYDIEVEFFEE